MQLFYIPTITGNEIVLDEAESKHAIKVLRLGVGSRVQLTDGEGGFFTAEITDPNPKKCQLEIIEFKPQYGKRNFEVHVAIAPTKNTDRIEWFLEKATEIGIDSVSFLLCENSERKTIKTERMEKVVISAMKQSLKAYLPRINTLTSFEEFIRSTNYSLKFIAHCQGGEKSHLKNVVEKEDSVLILIGPEGDFSKEEIKLAQMHGFREISLGTSRLRTETAGIVACHIVNLINE
jgi:16S rRNA (uracil1498-N3)-methyltransferase